MGRGREPIRGAIPEQSCENKLEGEQNRAIFLISMAAGDGWAGKGSGLSREQRRVTALLPPGEHPLPPQPPATGVLPDFPSQKPREDAAKLPAPSTGPGAALPRRRLRGKQKQTRGTP